MSVNVYAKKSTYKPGMKTPEKKMRSEFHDRLKNDIFMAAGIGDTKWLRQSLSYYGGAFEGQNEDGLSPVHVAALECQVNTLKMLMSSKSCNINQTSKNGWTALHLAINNTMVKKSIQCVKYLLDLGADPSCKSSCGITPMHQAAAVGNIKCMKLLLDRKAKFDCIDSRGHSPWSLAILWGHKDCARLLKHNMWLLSKRLEAKKLHLQEEAEQERQKLLEEKLKDQKEEKTLRAQAAYKAWLSKNNFPYLPEQFGPTSTEERMVKRYLPKRSQSLTVSEPTKDEELKTPTHRSVHVKSSQSYIAGMPQSAAVRHEDHLDDKIYLIPLASLAAAASKRPQLAGAQLDLARRQQHTGRPRIVHKKGALQFPVI